MAAPTIPPFQPRLLPWPHGDVTYTADDCVGARWTVTVVVPDRDEVTVAVNVEVAVAVTVSVTTNSTVDTEVKGISVVTVLGMTEMTVDAASVTVCVVATAEMHAHAEEYSSRLGQLDAMGKRGAAVDDEVVVGSEDVVDPRQPLRCVLFFIFSRTMVLFGASRGAMVVTVARTVEYAVTVSYTSAETVTVSSMVETLVVSETMMSVYETVAVVVSRTTSADGVMVVTTGEPNRDTHAEYWACGF